MGFCGGCKGVGEHRELHSHIDWEGLAWRLADDSLKIALMRLQYCISST